MAAFDLPDPFGAPKFQWSQPFHSRQNERYVHNETELRTALNDIRNQPSTDFPASYGQYKVKANSSIVVTGSISLSRTLVIPSDLDGLSIRFAGGSSLYANGADPVILIDGAKWVHIDGAKERPGQTNPSTFIKIQDTATESGRYNTLSNVMCSGGIVVDSAGNTLVSINNSFQYVTASGASTVTVSDFDNVIMSSDLHNLDIQSVRARVVGCNIVNVDIGSAASESMFSSCHIGTVDINNSSDYNLFSACFINVYDDDPATSGAGNENMLAACRVPSQTFRTSTSTANPSGAAGYNWI